VLARPELRVTTLCCATTVCMPVFARMLRSCVACCFSVCLCRFRLVVLCRTRSSKVLLPGAASPRVVPFELQRVSLPSSLLVVRKKSREACACVLAVRVCPVPYDFLWMLERADTY
jgi:hypothetical protein